MSIISIEFIIFIICSLVIYHIIPAKYKWIILLITSYIFYSFGGIKTIGYLIVTTISTYLAGRKLENLNQKIVSIKNNKSLISKYTSWKKRIIFITCILNFGLLFSLKYLNLGLIIPLGISFYIFQSIGYIIDIYRNKISAEKNIFKFALFVSFFPQMIQGPISRYNLLSPQLLSENKFDFKNIEEGLKLLLWGYFKKLLIADRAAIAVNLIFNNYLNYKGSIILFSVILYCIQLYCDFSGGIDIIRGVSKLYGITLIENFKRPFFAKSLADFWRRWHISLGSWMKDYVFYPLSLSKPFIKLGKFIRKHIKGKSGQIIPVSIVTFIVYFLIGIWHGASFKYIAFGFWNGTLITIALLLEPTFIKIKNVLKIKNTSKIYNIFQVLRTSFLVLIGRYITRAGNFGTAIDMLKITITNFNFKELINGTILNLGLKLEDLVIIFIGILFILIIEFLEEKNIDLFKKLKSSPTIFQFIITFSFIAIIFIFGIYRDDYISSEFIYKQF